MSALPNAMPFEPLRVYDAPGVLLGQLLDNRTTFAGIKDTLLSPERLSPGERQSVGDLIKQSAGAKDPITRTLIDVATNPMVWLLFLTSAPGGATVKEGGQLFGAAAKYSAFVRKTAGWLSPLKTAAEKLRGTHVNEVLADAGHAFEGMRDVQTARRSGALSKLMDSMGVDSLNLKDYTAGTPEHAKVEEVLTAMEAHKFDLHGTRGVNGVTISRDLFNGAQQVDEQVYNNLLKQYAAHLDAVKVAYQEANDLKAAGANRDAVAEAFQRAADLKKEGAEKFQLWARPVVKPEEVYRLPFDLDRARTDEILAKYPGAREAAEEDVRLQEETLRGMMFKGSRPATDDEIEAWVSRKKLSGVSHLAEGDLQGVLAEYARDPEKGRALLPEFVKRYEGPIPSGMSDLDQMWSGVDDPKAIRFMDDADKTFRKMASEFHAQRASEPDADKLYKILRSTTGKPEQVRGLLQNVQGSKQGIDGLALLLSEDVMRGFGMGKISKGELQEHIVKALTGGIQDSYLPLNMVGDVAPSFEAGRLLDRDELQAFREGRIPSLTGSAVGRASRDPLFTVDTLQRFQRVYGETPGLRRAIDETQGVADAMAKRGMAFGAYEIDGLAQTEKYLHRGNITRALYVDAPGEAVVRAQRSTLPLIGKAEAEFAWSHLGEQGPEAVKLNQVFEPGTEHIFNRNDALEQGLSFIQDESTRKMVTDGVIPTLFGTQSAEQGGLRAAMHEHKGTALALANSKFGQILERMGRPGAKVVEMFRKFGDPNTEMPSGKSVSGALARWLYSTHLGLNMGSVTMNATQPFILVAPFLGFPSTMKGYAAALGEMRQYAESRVAKYGIKPITEAQRAGLIKDSFKYATEAGISGDFLKQLDSVVYAGRRYTAGSKVEMVEQYLMKAFEKSEWLNRLTTAHALEASYVRAGRPLDATFRSEMEQLVQRTQFTSGATNTPDLFLRRNNGGFANKVLSNPLTKQFLTFPVRSMTAVFDSMPLAGSQENYWKGLGLTLARGLGASALIYELGKGLIHADLSRGLFASAATDLVGGNRFLQNGNEWVPIPPVVDIPKDFVAGLATGDGDLMRDSVARSFPGGLAIMRALGVSPDLSKTVFPISMLGGLQKTYADYGRPTPEGLVPVMNSDGRVTGFRSPTELILRGLGLDLGGFQRAGEQDGYLVKQRDEILGYRQQYINALLSNDFRGASAVQQEFQRRFKLPNGEPIPLTITQDQVKQFISNRDVPRTERILDRLPPEARAAYSAMVASSGGPIGLNVPSPSLSGQPTSGRRSSQRTAKTKIDPQVAAEIDRRVRSVGPAQATTGSPRSFEGFAGF